MATHFVLLDASSIGMTDAARFHRTFDGQRDRWVTKGGFPNGAIHGMVDAVLYALRAVQEAVPHDALFPVLLWDGRAQWRYDLYPRYKERSTDAGHMEVKEKFKQQVPVLRSLWLYAGIPQVIAVDEEADDVAGHLAPRLAEHGRVTLISKDGDWVQTVSTNVSCYVHGEHARFIRVEDLPKLGGGGKFGYADVRAYLQCKALAGDASDKIVGVDKVGMATAAKLLDEFGSVERFWAAVDCGRHVPTGVIRTRLAGAEGRELFARNILLMDWSLAPQLQPSTFLWVDAAQPEEAQQLLHELELRHIAPRFADYRAPLDYHAELRRPSHPLHLALEHAQWREAAEAAQ